MKIAIQQKGSASATITDNNGNVLLHYELSDVKLEISMAQLVTEMKTLATIIKAASQEE